MDAERRVTARLREAPAAMQALPKTILVASSKAVAAAVMLAGDGNHMLAATPRWVPFPWPGTCCIIGGSFQR